ncbi:hypothetical protein KQ51_01392 [Candidatus Izimaplasma bacterium HR1]|uniref:hypothetical protein n=1 Tax=Candidatus Izimoplasma sp. HR1 TaxID=1541959 RepID=UPI0004F61FC3|nr:hypothetical protein KQ51_01392 [Candidatus Izimaplasma bacterium HR1]
MMIDNMVKKLIDKTKKGKITWIHVDKESVEIKDIKGFKLIKLYEVQQAYSVIAGDTKLVITAERYMLGSAFSYENTYYLYLYSKSGVIFSQYGDSNTNDKTLLERLMTIIKKGGVDENDLLESIEGFLDNL